MPDKKGTKFDPEGSGYDYKTAREAGLKPGKNKHWPSRDPRTGLILKGRNHPTFWKTIKGEKEAGYFIFRGPNGRYYSLPNPDRILQMKMDILNDK